MSTELFYIIASCISKMFVFGSQNLNNHEFFKKVVRSKSSHIFAWISMDSLENFPISFTNCLRMVPWTASKNWGFQVFCNFNNFILRVDFQNYNEIASESSGCGQKTSNFKYLNADFYWNVEILSTLFWPYYSFLPSAFWGDLEWSKIKQDMLSSSLVHIVI